LGRGWRRQRGSTGGWIFSRFIGFAGGKFFPELECRGLARRRRTWWGGGQREKVVRERAGGGVDESLDSDGSGAGLNSPGLVKGFSAGLVF
jgi:hypothetical protein